jgi:hypothetical protein
MQKPHKRGHWADSTLHHFHHEWISAMSSALNHGVLPRPYYALAEQIAGGLGPDVLALEGPRRGNPSDGDLTGALALASEPPKVRFRARAEADLYVAKANAVVIRHASGHEVVAMVEIVSPEAEKVTSCAGKAGEVQ